jgi:tetratricopeptide (TPR) repeat protein
VRAIVFPSLLVRRWLRLLPLFALAWTATAQRDLAYQWNDQGLAAAERGAYKKAEALYRKAMDRWRALGPGHDAHFAVTEVNLADAQCEQGRRKDCERSLEDSLSIFRRTLGVRNGRTLANMNLLAGVALMLAEVGDAERLYDEALPIERELYPHGLELARTLGGLAEIRTQQSSLEDALRLGEEALTLTLEIDGEKGADAALEYSIVAEVHRMSGRLDRALPLYRKSQEIYEKVLGPEHPRVGCVLSAEGLILISEHKYASAEQMLLHARRIMDRSCPNCGLEQSMVLGNLGMLRLRQERFKEAEELLTKALGIEERFMRKPGRLMAVTLQSLAEVLRHERRFEEAARLKERAGVISAYR